MRRRRVSSATIAGLLVCGVVGSSLVVAGAAASAAQAPRAAAVTEITVDGDDIAADNVNGLTFKGFGVLTANSTSAVLMDYKSEQPEKYAELLQVLFVRRPGATLETSKT